MKIKILKNVWVEVEKTRLQEIWDKELRRYDVITIDKIENMGNISNICTYDGDVFLRVPSDSFEICR